MTKIWQALLSLGAILPGVAAAQDNPDERGHHADRSGEVRRAGGRGEGWQGGFRQPRQVDRGGDAQARDQRPQRDSGRERPDFRQDAPSPAIVAPPAYVGGYDRQDGRSDDRRRGDVGQPDRRDGRRDGWADRRDGDRSEYRDRRDDGYRQDDRHQSRSGFADRRDDRREQGRFDERRHDNNRGWNRGWRQDRRYDWSDYRSANRGAYRLPRYYAPYGSGYGYRRFGIGVTLSSVLFGQNYWIDDPYDYRLPPAYGPYRWVRYYDDALLVDVRSGIVVDTVYDIFD